MAPFAEIENFALLAEILPTQALSMQQSIIFSNVKTLNQVFFSIHPEYSR